MTLPHLTIRFSLLLAAVTLAAGKSTEIAYGSADLGDGPRRQIGANLDLCRGGDIRQRPRVCWRFGYRGTDSTTVSAEILLFVNCPEIKVAAWQT